LFCVDDRSKYQLVFADPLTFIYLQTNNSQLRVLTLSSLRVVWRAEFGRHLAVDRQAQGRHSLLESSTVSCTRTKYNS